MNYDQQNIKADFQSHRITIVKKIPVYTWSWALGQDGSVCGICQQSFDFCCESCIYPRKCPPCQGSCSHKFHLHCIERWVARQRAITDDPPHCPMCRQDWQIKEL